MTTNERRHTMTDYSIIGHGTDRPPTILMRTNALIPGWAEYRLDGSRIRSGMGRCSCNAWWTGIAAAHCSGCHRTFTSVSGFTTHRKRGACGDPEALGMVPADRKWEGWALPGTYTPGDDA